MESQTTALILIGYQNDYFSPNGILYGVVEESSKVTNVISNTVHLLQHLASTPALIVTTPIFFTPNYEELIEPIGILKTIKEVNAFQMGTPGSETIEELYSFQDRIQEIPGKRGFNAFINTNLGEVLKQRKITDVVLAGAVTSICIDSTGRSAHEKGYHVTILSDCTSARTVFEQEFYCGNIFPLYAEVMTHIELLRRLELTVTA
ncbi:cysteine hydrolase family protein [Nostocaceae cyanobacterium CENA357]|uniref:Cysteine hydrolase family protein n=1 Tax=Atlanticothrix silvestris CENA357 TaxID=1725252 RepID=A0A8J7L467_9CYAN|nr:cysteine hydrolase family protein [Atlanticothrix silvestris]MBH8554649.1 cysteine hydrolase family protein [Atlanticothrix silvestris CENA357]